MNLRAKPRIDYKLLHKTGGKVLKKLTEITKKWKMKI